MNRIAKVKRETSEVKVSVELNLDGTGNYSINTGIAFFDHMLEQLSKHGYFDLKMNFDNYLRSLDKFTKSIQLK